GAPTFRLREPKQSKDWPLQTARSTSGSIRVSIFYFRVSRLTACSSSDIPGSGDRSCAVYRAAAALPPFPAATRQPTPAARNLLHHQSAHPCALLRTLLPAAETARRWLSTPAPSGCAHHSSGPSSHVR